MSGWFVETILEKQLRNSYWVIVVIVTVTLAYKWLLSGWFVETILEKQLRNSYWVIVVVVTVTLAYKCFLRAWIFRNHFSYLYKNYRSNYLFISFFSIPSSFCRISWIRSSFDINEKVFQFSPQTTLTCKTVFQIRLYC